MEPPKPKRGRTLGWTVPTLGALAAVAAAFVAFHDPAMPLGPAVTATVEPPRDERPEIDAARRQIAAASRGEVPAAAVVRAPAQHGGGSGGGGDVGASPVPAPPDGYAFTSAPTNLHRRPLPPPDLPADGEQPHDQDLDWLVQERPAAAVLRHARRAQRSWVFGWLRLADGANAAEVAKAVSPFGIEVIGASGGLLRAKLPADRARIAAAVALEAVSGLGVVPPQRKAHAAFQAELEAAPWRSAPALITLMANDEDGRWRRELLARGAEVGDFDADIRAYAANVDAAALDAIIQADFVLAVEPMGIVRARHDTAVPAMGVDAVRVHMAAPGVFRGTAGGGVPIGVLDTGLNANHLDIASHRSSICGANFVTNDQRLEDADLWVDKNGHGTHVTGTFVGNGFAEAKYAGMAPGVSHIRLAKVLNRFGWGFLSATSRGMDFLSRPSGCGAEAVAVKPLVVNVSLSSDGKRWHGRTPAERKLDAVVWGHRQLYVVAQSNAGISNFSNYGAAKNSLSVGAIRDNGELASFSSWGPTFDGRLAPQVVATGVDIHSAEGDDSRGGYRRLSGTSMASPAVAGVAALLLDAVAGYREQPALTRARLMASAIKPDPWLDGDAFPATNTAGPGVLQHQFGLGKASARTSVLQRMEADGWENGAATATLEHGDAADQDIEVPEGASRLDVVLAWDEPPADTIGSTVLNDLDLWLDQGGDCGAGACGEYSSTSKRDNVEWIIVKNPVPGTYRARVVGRRVYAGTPRAGLAWTVVRGPSTPTLRLALDRMRSLGGRRHRVTLSVSVDGYVAAGVRVGVSGCRGTGHTWCRPAAKVRPVTGEGGIAHTPSATATEALVGEVGVGERQQVAFDVDLQNQDDPIRLYFKADAWNAKSAIASVTWPAADGAAAEPPVEANPPANDHFANATALRGASGSAETDLLAATFEPGESPPPYSVPAAVRPWASVWFRWTAPARGSAHFNLPLYAHVDVYRGQHVAALTQLASGEWGASFFAEAGETYRIRISHIRRSSHPEQVTLSWSQGPRPANDDFDAAVELVGAEGKVSGDNLGATLEPEERIGDFAATVWYRWTAPEDGSWRFVDYHTAQSVFVFTGDSVAALRLVSSGIGNRGTVPVKAGVEYRIAIAAQHAFASGRSFELEWKKADRPPSADDFAYSHELAGASGAAPVRVGESVEPGEPAQTGVRTRWWRWKAPASGRFTWRLTNPSASGIKVSVFASANDDEDGDTGNGEVGADMSPADLRLVASTGPRVTSTELSFAAVDERRYWISVGFHNGDRAAFESGHGSATLNWGQAPANDSLAQAIVLAGNSGSMTASNGLATLAPDEPSGALGHSSLWWSFITPSDAGWHRFRVEGADTATLAVYRVRGTGFEGLERVARSHGDWRAPHEADAVSALFDAIDGQRYLIRVGQRGEGSADEWTLHWQPAAAPTWLRYVGRSQQPSALGPPDEAPTSAALAFGERGEFLYLGTSKGLHVLARNAGTGALRVVRRASVSAPRALLWDETRRKLYAFIGCGWRRFAPGDASPSSLVDEGALAIVDGEPPPCEVLVAFLDATGGYLQHGHSDGMEVYALAESGLTAVQSVAMPDLKHAAPGADGLVYATYRYSLEVLQREQDTGALAAVGAVDLADSEEAIAISDEGYVLALSEDGSTTAYALAARPAAPRHIDTLAPFGNASWPDRDGGCRFIAARPGTAAIDVFCDDSAFSVALASAAAETTLQATDYMAHWQPDRFNNHLPKFEPRGLATSPDGRHAYVYSKGEILIFERVGAGVAEGT